MSYRTPSKIIILNNYAEIVLTDIYGKEKAKTFIDLEDIQKVSMYRWSLTGNNYVRQHTKNLSLHRYLVNAPKNYFVDHINHNTLDNRKYNLRICTNEENNANCKVSKNSTSKVTGVSWSKEKNKWRAYITNYRITQFLGYFSLKEEAIRARKNAEQLYFKQFAYKGELNEI